MGEPIRTVISLGARSPTRSSSQPAASLTRRTASRRLFGLAPAGVYPATTVAGRAVRSYRTFSTLPDPPLARRPSAVCFLWHCPSHRPRAIRPGVTWQPVHGARTFLGGRERPTRPSDRERCLKYNGSGDSLNPQPPLRERPNRRAMSRSTTRRGSRRGASQFVTAPGTTAYRTRGRATVSARHTTSATRSGG